MEAEKTSKFKNFLKLIKFSNEVKEIPQENIQVDIDLKDEANQAARRKVDDLFSSALAERDLEKLEIIFKRNFTMNYYQFIRICKNYDFYSKNETVKLATDNQYANEIKHVLEEELVKLNNINSLSLNRDLQQLSHNISLVWSIYDKKPDFQDKEYALEFRELCAQLIEKIPSFSNRERENNPTHKLRSTLEGFRKYIENEHKDYYDDLIKTKRQAELLEFTQQLNEASGAFNTLKTVKEHIKIGLRENINRLSAVELPPEAKEFVQEISKTANEIFPMVLNEKQKFEFDNLYQKRLPQVLEEYVTISPRYKDMLKHHNESPDRILIDCLSEIKTKVDILFETLQEDNLNKQKITRQYLKSI